MGNALQGHDNWVNSVAFSPDGTRIVSGSDDKTLRIWVATTGAQMGNALQGHDDVVNSVAFAPDGTPGLCLALMTRHSGSIAALAFESDEREQVIGTSRAHNRIQQILELTTKNATVL
ncbi:hypothetical protein BT96DRAFT_1009531 [Gymnopus androsaceus JB14]|uniref:Uncharacterized protein n=1 Tax=Gymnopus androsaceus JB14 TaxID=1447944 RepID=A0A6A4GCH3_9AGAR|nr:hypothetical protein BT96DRAFT_1009531 [Gymnopus androsaceus JB14]